MAKGFKFKAGTLKDPIPAYDAIQDMLQIVRSLDRKASIELRGMLEERRLSQSGPLGMAIADTLISFIPQTDN